MIEPAKAEQIPAEQTIFNEAWRILKKYCNIEQNSPDDEWEALIAEASVLAELPTGAKGSRLARDISLAILSHIETVTRERKKVNE